jgi:hypothetical protein
MLELNEGPGEGERWQRLAEWLRTQVAAEEVDGIWVFRVVRRDQREFGTAVLSLVTGDRRRIVTARYVALIKGRERGGFSTQIEEVGSGPLEALHELLAMVPVRADDEDPPAAVDIALWFPPDAGVTATDDAEPVTEQDAEGRGD